MKIETYNSGIYRVLKIGDQLIISELQELKLLIEGYIERDEKYIAVNFCDVSYLFSGAVAVLVTCYTTLRDRGGELCLIESKPEMMDLLKVMGIDTLIPIFESDGDLPVDIRQIEITFTGDFRG
ncbi:MAG TPA: STAS domain-containing protein [Chitinispirillaceae bacterium]|nr:STAS domain-containing protein [Chitinispirillaceae bacterium]